LNLKIKKGMTLNDLKLRVNYKRQESILESSLVSEAEVWSHYFSVGIAGILAAGWLENDDVFVHSNSYDSIFEINTKQLIQNVHEEGNDYMSLDNLHYDVKCRNERIDIFGLRGGDGNRITKNNIELIGILEFQCWKIIETNIIF
jgi:hypothetical protein